MKDLPYYQDTWQRLQEIKTGLFSTLAAENYAVLAADVHFALIRTKEAAGESAGATAEPIHSGAGLRFFGLPQYIRVSAKLPVQNQRLINAFAEIRSSLEINHSVSKKGLIMQFPEIPEIDTHMAEKQLSGRSA